MIYYMLFISCWHKFGTFHRINGPAIKKNSDFYWFQDGMLHREDGPAIEFQNGKKKWYRNGKYVKV